MVIENPANPRRPQLHILITEDETHWIDRIRVIADHLKNWSFYRSGQFNLQVYDCRSVQEFKETAARSLESGALTYTTIDLNMPVFSDDTVANDRAGEMMITWCLDQRESDPDVARRLEFCLISGMDGILDRIDTIPKGEELKKQRVKRIHKHSIDEEGHGNLKLIDISADIKDFLLRNIQICSYIDPSLGRTSARIPIWFSDRQPLIGLLAKADQIANATEPGVYLMFSDAAGYEVDWVHLCCNLRNLRLSVCDIRRTDAATDNWDWCFRDPPQALLVRNVEYANLRHCNLEPFLVGGDFFKKVRENNSLVFFQFPFFETQLGVSQRLDEEIEQPVLNACLRHIYSEGPPFPPGIGFAFKSHQCIVTFPSYKLLREQGVLRHSILLQAGQSSEQMGCNGVGIDHEIFAVISEIDWNKHQGLQALRQIINAAYQNFAASTSRGNAIGIDNFTGTVVEKQFHGELGLQVRGRLLYRLLEERTPLITPEDLDVAAGGVESRKALAHLETLYRIYDGLDRLIELRNDLGFVKTSKHFSVQDYDALHEAKRFLELLFGTPQALRRQLAEFRANIHQSGWRHFYPLLETRQGWAAVENIRFSWPFTRLHLHPAVHAYLKQNGVGPLIHREIDEYLDRHQDLKSEWYAIEEKRIALKQLLLEREKQRENALEHAHSSHTRPVLIHLEQDEAEDEPWVSLADLVETFFRFEIFAAACEDHYFFRSLPGAHRRLLQELLQGGGTRLAGPYLCAYVEALRREGQLNNSIFCNWSDEWAGAGNQSDAVRLAQELARLIADVHRPILANWSNELALVDKITKLGNEGRGCCVEAVLGLLYLGGRLSAEHGDAIEEELLDCKDLMRRMITATNDPHRLGVVDASGTSIELWCKDKGSQPEPADLLDRRPSEWAQRLVIAKESPAASDSYEALFPIDECIRLRPQRASLWAMETPEKWRNVTLYPDHDEENTLAPAEQPWLPDPQQTTASALWRRIHGSRGGE